MGLAGLAVAFLPHVLISDLPTAARAIAGDKNYPLRGLWFPLSWAWSVLLLVADSKEGCHV